MSASELEAVLSNQFSAVNLRMVGNSVFACDEFQDFPSLLLFASYVCFDIAEEWVGGGAVTAARSEQLEEALGQPLCSLLRSIFERDEPKCHTIADQLASRVATVLYDAP